MAARLKSKAVQRWIAHPICRVSAAHGLRSVQEQLENLYNQQAAAKAEVGKPFPQEQELAAKTARLIELDMELNLDGKGQPQPEQAIAKSARPSVLDRLKASPVHGAPEKPHKKEMEAR